MIRVNHDTGDDKREYEIPDENVGAVIGELAALEAIHEVSGEHRERALIYVTDENVETLARAFDHLRNLAADASKAIVEVRDSLLRRLNTSPLTYRLRSWEFEGEDRTFWSYTGTYEQGDRLVTADGQAFKVTSVQQQATPTEDGVLVLERIRT